ncbi:MAG: Stk1 family PASTA domain-containing Ser/Thr kinase [Nostocoides sp.]
MGVELDGRYRVLERLAEGGMATVYLALDTRLDREVALKIMRPDLAQDPAFVARFHREARSAAQLSHPNVVAVFDQGQDTGQMFLAMEYVPGQTLREVLDAEGALTPRAATDILLPVLGALGAAHAAGIIHRDIKPENVIIREDGVVKVADFGLARAVATQTSTTSGVLLGTASYLSPEQVLRGIADARSDVYAAGLVLFEMLTGSKAVSGDHPVQVAYQHVHTGVPAPSSRAEGVPAVLDALVATATAKDPDHRPVDARAMAALLRTARRELTPAELDARPVGAQAVAAAAADVTARLEIPRPVASASAGTTGHTAPLRVPPLSAPVKAEPEHAAYGQEPPRRIWPWALIVLALLIGGLGAWLFTAGPMGPTTVPEVAGRNLDAARTALFTQNLSGRVVDQFSETVTKGTVIGSSPVAGTQVRKNRTITLDVSKGPERYAVPPLVGLTSADAATAIGDAHLAVGTTKQAYSETLAAGQVISSDPPPGTSVKRDAPVNLVVSKGKQPIPAGDWTGKPADQATAALTKAGLGVDATQQAFSDTVATGSVVSQTPANTDLHKGDTVTLVVSKGPQLVTIPDGLVGKQVREVRRILEALSLKVEVRNVFGGKFGTVTDVSPGSGSQVAPGSTVEVVVV